MYFRPLHRIEKPRYLAIVLNPRTTGDYEATKSLKLYIKHDLWEKNKCMNKWIEKTFINSVANTKE